MRELWGDMWKIACTLNADGVCVTTNLQVKANGSLVMGKGVALEAVWRFPWLPERWGKIVSKQARSKLIVTRNENMDFALIAFPTKHHWRERSNIDLIQRSAEQLCRIIDKRGWLNVILPRPGCHNGGLEWTNVRETIGQILGDEVIAVTNEV